MTARQLLAAWLFGSMLGLLPQSPVGGPQSPTRTPAEPDAAVLCAALSGLGRWVTDWDKRTVLVFDNGAAQPAFPWSKSQAALAAAADPSFDPMAKPAPDQDLVVDKGPTIPAALVASALERASAVRLLPQPACERTIVVETERLAKLFKDDIPKGWQEYRKLFPQGSGIVSCSAPGYDAARSVAITSCSYTSGALNGVGVFVVLEKQGSAWQVTWSRSLWVS